MEQVIYYINRANQRSERMLSIIDLLNAGTLNLPQAARLTARIYAGSSFLVGAKPGSAGKTTVMGALLNMIPKYSVINLPIDGSDWRKSKENEYILSYEIGAGHYDCYIWGETLREFMRLGAEKRRIVSNIHADTLEEAYEQIVIINKSKEGHFNSFAVFIPIRIAGAKRIIEQISFFDGIKWNLEDNDIKLNEDETNISEFLLKCQKDKVVLIENVRNKWLEFKSE